MFFDKHLALILMAYAACWWLPRIKLSERPCIRLPFTRALGQNRGSLSAVVLCSAQHGGVDGVASIDLWSQRKHVSCRLVAFNQSVETMQTSLHPQGRVFGRHTAAPRHACTIHVLAQPRHSGARLCCAASPSPTAAAIADPWISPITITKV